jgi:hypothetical protein
MTIIIIIIIIIMSMGWDYVCELWPQTGLLFISQMIYEHGEPWWNYVTDRGKLLICPPELSGNPTSSHLVASRRNGQKEWEFGLVKYFCSYLHVIFTCQKILWHGASSVTSPLKEGVVWISITLKNPLPWPYFNPWTLCPTLTITPPRQLVE